MRPKFKFKIFILSRLHCVSAEWHISTHTTIEIFVIVRNIAHTH